MVVHRCYTFKYTHRGFRNQVGQNPQLQRCHTPTAASCCLRFRTFPHYNRQARNSFLYEDVAPLQYRHVAFQFLLKKEKKRTVYGKLVPNSVLSKQKETGSADTRCCSVLKQTCGLFGKPVIFWQHYLQIQIFIFYFAQRNTSWQTEVLMYLSKFSLLNEFRWNKAYHRDVFFCFLFSNIYHLFAHFFF